MEIVKRESGEIVATWTSFVHPEMPGVALAVSYTHVAHPDGRQNLIWRRAHSGTAAKQNIIAGITLERAKELYLDDARVDISDDEFERWKAQRGHK